MKLNYFYGKEADQFKFYRIPKILVHDERFKNVSSGAKLLYGVLLDRMGLSAQNGWLDEQGRVYIIFSIEEIRKELGCSNDKAVRMLAELDSKKGVGLIERKKRGQGKPDLIFVKKFIHDTRRSLENHTSEPHKYENHTCVVL